MSREWLLAIWTLGVMLWELLIIGGCSYLVFWKGHSGWWFVLAIALSCQTTYYKAMAQYFGVKED